MKYWITFALILSSSAMAQGQSKGQGNKNYTLHFLDELTMHHKDGMDMAQMAGERAAHPELQEAAKKMAEDQQREINEMQSWRKAWYPDAKEYKSRAPGMNMEKMKSLQGNEFDLAFLDSMLIHHPGAIYLGIEAMSRSNRNEVKKMAEHMTKMQKQELEQLRKWRKEWDE